MIARRVRADGSKVWDAQYGRAGLKRTFDTKAAADEYVEEEKANRRRERAGMGVTRAAITFQQLADLYKQNFDPSDWRLRMLAHSEKKWGAVMVRSIKPEGVGAWIHSLPLAGKTQKHILETFRQVMNAGVEWGYLHRSPAKPGSFRAPSEKRVRPIRPFESWSEVERVCERLDPYPAALIRFACATGVRLPNEAIELKWSDISFQKRELIVHGTKTKSAPRTIPLSQLAIDALQSLPRSITGRVFVGKTGGRFDYTNWRDEEWRTALAEAGLDHRTPYECRHTFATLALQAGASLDEVAEVLGHADITITRRYYRKWTRPMMDRLRGVLNTIGEEQDGREDQADRQL